MEKMILEVMIAGFGLNFGLMVILWVYINKKFDKIDERFNKITEEFKEVKKCISQLHSRISRLKGYIYRYDVYEHKIKKEG